MKKKLSALLLIVLTFTVLYESYNIFLSLKIFNDDYGVWVDKRKTQVDLFLDFSANYLAHNTPKALLPRLQKARENGMFDFFILKETDKVLGFFEYTNKLANINFDYQNLQEFRQNENVAFNTLAIGDYKLTIGINISKKQYEADRFKAIQNSMFVDLLLIFLLIAGVAGFYLKDIRRVAKALASKERTQIKNVGAISKEGEILIEASQSFEIKSENLQKDKNLLLSITSPAIHNEIRKKKSPPYRIPSSLLRIDINGYTRLMLERSPVELSKVLDIYFAEVRTIAERFQGNIYQYVGDEVIIVFDHPNSDTGFLLGLGCAGAIFDAGNKLRTPLTPDGVRVKASIVRGDLHFIKLDQGFSLTGVPLIETVRMLGQVSEKKENSLIVYHDEEKTLAPYVHIYKTSSIVMKGFQQPSPLAEIRTLRPIEESITERPCVEFLSVFRTSSEIAATLDYIRTNHFPQYTSPAIEERINEWLKAFANLPNLHATRTETLSSEQKQMAKNLNSSFQQFLLAIPNEKHSWIATALTLASKLFDSENISTELLEITRSYLTHPDQRTRSNAINTLAKLYSDNSAQFPLSTEELRAKSKSQFNREAADALLLLAKQEFSRDIFEQIRTFLRSTDPLFVASGLYVATESVNHFKKQDIVYYNTNAFLKELEAEIPDFLNHHHPLVKRRAQISFNLLNQDLSA